MKLGLSCYTWPPQVSIKTLHCWMNHGAASVDLRVTATWWVDHGSQVDKRFHLLDILSTDMKTGWFILGGAQCLNHRLLPVYYHVVTASKSCQWMPRILCRQHWSSASIRCRSTLLIAQHSDSSSIIRSMRISGLLLHDEWIMAPM